MLHQMTARQPCAQPLASRLTVIAVFSPPCRLIGEHLRKADLVRASMNPNALPANFLVLTVHTGMVQHAMQDVPLPTPADMRYCAPCRMWRSCRRSSCGGMPPCWPQRARRGR
jgi:hypothetical protein